MSNVDNLLILTTILAALGMWLILPRGTAPGRAAGAVLAAIAFGLSAFQMPYLGDWVGQSVFSILACVTVVAAACTVSFRNPVYCAVWFGLCLLGVAGLFLLTGAQFLAVATIVVYAGAILITFLFVLMLAQPEGKALYDRLSWEAFVSASAGMVIVAVLSLTVGSVLGGTSHDLHGRPIAAPDAGQLASGVLSPYHVASVGMELFGRHLIAVEVAGTLLLVAIVGAAVIVAQSQKVLASESREEDSESTVQGSVVLGSGARAQDTKSTIL